MPKLQIIPQNISAKRVHQSGYASNLFPKRIPKIIFQSSVRKLPRQNYCRKLLRKIIYFKPSSQSYFPKSQFFKLLLFKDIVQSCRAKLFLLPKAAPQSCSPKLLPKAAPQSCSPKLLPKAAPKVVPQSCSQSCSLKLLPKAVPGSSFQSYSPRHRRKVAAPKLLCFKHTPQSGSPPKRLPKIAPQSCCGKLLPKVAF